MKISKETLKEKGFTEDFKGVRDYFLSTKDHPKITNIFLKDGADTFEVEFKEDDS